MTASHHVQVALVPRRDLGERDLRIRENLLGYQQINKSWVRHFVGKRTRLA
jgi:hypothetical protein